MTRTRVYGSDAEFGRWVRCQRDMDSSPNGAALTVNDVDYLFHRYMVNVDAEGTRDVHCMLWLEVKTRGGSVSQSQRQTLWLSHQLLNSKKALLDCGGQRKVAVWNFGVFVLQLGVTCAYPGQGSEYVHWCQFDDCGNLIRTQITVDTLRDILTFRTRPDTLQPLSLRRHHKTRELVNTVVTDLGFKVDEVVKRRS